MMKAAINPENGRPQIVDETGRVLAEGPYDGVAEIGIAEPGLRLIVRGNYWGYLEGQLFLEKAIESYSERKASRENESAGW